MSGRETSEWRGNIPTDEFKFPGGSPLYAKATTQGTTASPFLSAVPNGVGHTRHHSFTPPSTGQLVSTGSRRTRSNSLRNSSFASGTFAPQFIKSEKGLQGRNQHVNHIEGENDFSGKRYVWLKDHEKTFVQGWVIQELMGGRILVQCDDGSQREVDAESVDKVNPAKFDKVSDMAELTHLNEASVVHNLHMRYQADLIYTYSGLFLVTVNPYCPLPIYTKEYINMYRGQSREDMKPHIFAMADEAFRNLIEEGDNQSILVTGESGAGKTENTKKVIQYLAAVATADVPGSRSAGKALPDLSQQILRANPMLEAFGNAQTVRNNNSSRFGKFIRIQFSRSGQIVGAYIDWYLLEKSRVVKLSSNERNYHIFYQLLRGADDRMKQELLLLNQGVEDFEYTRHGNDIISGVSDQEEWNALIEAFHIMGFSEKDQLSILRTVAAVLHLGNINVSKESLRGDQASLDIIAMAHANTVCQLLGIAVQPFVQALLHPRVKAGREWVQKAQTPDQVRLAIDALSKGIYERAFGDLVDKINRRLNQASAIMDDTNFIGVLDIAGFEIFDENSFEQLCINYTNEKLQQFFNHHMFVLEQEEYAREQIEWKFIDFGKDLQPTIDLIELTNPIGIFSCLDEDSVMPKATDKSFTEKLHSLWDRKTPKYNRSLLNQGFMITHYAAEVEYSTEGWLEKNKDPLNDNVTRILAASSDKHIAHLFSDCADTEEDAFATKNRVKKGLFRTVAQRHKEQLSGLMSKLHSTRPHFVRCILPNHKKRSKLFNANLVLDQLRCNGVLEGIRIARTGFPNRLPFAEFRSRYEVLCPSMPKGYLDGQTAAKIILEKLSLDPAFYRVGITKVFFRAGVLAELEEQRDALIREIMTRFQSVARGFARRRAINKQLYQAEAARIIQHNFQVYLNLQASPWWRLFVRMRPLLGATRQSGEIKKRDEKIVSLESKIQSEASEKQRVEEERRRAEMHVSEIQATLEGERALALDKEEIFKRLQARETELEEKLADALEDQDSLEEQIDELLLVKKKAEDDVNLLRNDLEQAGKLISQLESEKQELSREAAQLTEKLSTIEDHRSETSLAEERLQQEIRMLNSQISLKDRKVQDLESKVVKADLELEVKLASTSKELQSSRREVKQLADDLMIVRQQLAEVSSTSTEHDDLLRLRDSELAILKREAANFESGRRALEEESRHLTKKHDDVQTRFRVVLAELDALKLHKSQLEREASDAKKLLRDKVNEDEQSVNGRKMLEKQIQDLKADLCKVQADLSRERQSRDDVQMLGDHKLNTIKREFDELNQSKITIEKELYVQQDVLRRTSEGRNAAEKDKREYQNELRSLRQRYLELQEAKIDAESAAERNSLRLAAERQTLLSRDLADREQRLRETQEDRDRCANEAKRLQQVIADSETYKVYIDQHKDRLERELIAIKGRLTASENDNRSLLNKVQQKNLDIARSSSRASDTQRSRITQLQSDKTSQEDNNRQLARQLEEARLTISSLEKQKEKLALGLEDLNHEVNREHKTSRNAEKASSSVTLQLAEANRKLETERQLRTQAQTNSRQIQITLDAANDELEDCHNQLMLLHKVFDPKTEELPSNYETSKQDIGKTIDLAKKLEESRNAVKVLTERCANAEGQVEALRHRHEDQVAEMDSRNTRAKRNMLEELDQNQVNGRVSSLSMRKTSESLRPPQNGFSTPIQRHLSNNTVDSARSDRTVDSVAFNKKMDLVSELELVQNQLQMSEMRNRHLQEQIDRSPTKNSWQDDSPSFKRVQKLERENFRLHDMLDDSAKKVSALENSIRTGHLTLQEVQTKSHEELFDLINSQEQSRRSLVHAHKSTIVELAEAKTVFDNLKHTKASLEVDVRDAKSELQDLKYEQEQEEASRAQLLQEFSELQIKLDAETSKLQDVTSSLNLYKARADEYYNKLEHAEMAVLKATRAEQFAKSQGREAEDTCATIVSERKEMDGLVEDLQRQVQQYEERVEDMSADLDGALQAKKRLQNELEDYRSQRAVDIEDKELSMEQTRQKYNSEFARLTGELELEREAMVSSRSENGRLRDELEDLRSRWDDEVLNSSTWAKEKSRLEMTLESLSNSRDEAVNAHNDAQSKIVSLLSQVRTLRSSIDDTTSERDQLVKDKKSLEGRLGEVTEKLQELSRSDSPSLRNAAGLERELLQLRGALAEQEDVTAAAVGKMRRSELLVQEVQKDMATERENNTQLYKQKDALDKSVKELQLRLVDLETKGYSSGSQDVRFLHGRVQELEKQVEDLESVRNKEQRSVRTVDRTVRDLQTQIERRDKANVQLNEDISKSRDKIERLLATIDELQSSDSTNQLQAKRAERELREEKEKALRLERELEGFKARLEYNMDPMRRSSTFRALSDFGGGGGSGGVYGLGIGDPRSRRGGSVPSFEIPQRKSSLTKNFL